MNATTGRWTREAAAEIYHSPVLELIYRAATLHRAHHDSREVQVCTLLSIKTGGCAENCRYCSQSAHYDTGLERQKLLARDEVVEAAQQAREAGSTRFCMGAAWRQVRDDADFERILEMVQQISSMGLEVCCTLGMLTEEQACRLKDAGLHAYNHNLDSGENYYSKIVTTRTYADRLQTLENVARARISLCCGGILGMGESDADRIDFDLMLSLDLSSHADRTASFGMGTFYNPKWTTDNYVKYMLTPYSKRLSLVVEEIFVDSTRHYEGIAPSKRTWKNYMPIPLAFASEAAGPDGDHSLLYVVRIFALHGACLTDLGI